MLLTVKNIIKLVGRHAFIALMVILIASLFIFFIARGIEHVSSSVTQNRDLVAILKKRTELFTSLQHDAQIVGPNYTLINNAFVSSDNILDFINNLEGLTPLHSNIQSYSFGTPIPSAISDLFPVATISYTDNLTMNVTDFSKYLKNFEHLPYFTKIKSINISSQNKNGWNDTSSASFEAVLYTKEAQ